MSNKRKHELIAVANPKRVTRAHEKIIGMVEQQFLNTRNVYPLNMCRAIIMEELDAVHMLCESGLADEFIEGVNAIRSPLALAATIGNADVCRILLMYSYRVYFSTYNYSFLIHLQQPRPFEIHVLQTLQQQLFQKQFECVMSSTTLPSDLVKLVLLFLQIPLEISLNNTHDDMNQVLQ